MNELHGSNAYVVIKSDGTQYCQSSDNVITPESDNCGFAKWHTDKKADFQELRKYITSHQIAISSYKVNGQVKGYRKA